MSPGTHRAVRWGPVAAGWGRGRHQSPPGARPGKGSAQVMSGLPASPSALPICETSQHRNVLLPRQPGLAGSASIPARDTRQPPPVPAWSRSSARGSGGAGRSPGWWQMKEPDHFTPNLPRVPKGCQGKFSRVWEQEQPQAGTPGGRRCLPSLGR